MPREDYSGPVAISQDEVQLAKMQALMTGVKCCATCTYYSPYAGLYGNKPNSYYCASGSQSKSFFAPTEVCKHHEEWTR